ncbi:hypothetical protein ACEUZ9_002853 [Paracoccus litorisediminis]|uniref:hypothetical protein n=1 Tax=Paracoccus litorisediminis TaxID=2006130 RepID=UPI00372EF176
MAGQINNAMMDQSPAATVPFGVNSPEVQELLRITRSIPWREENTAVSALSLFGWLAIAPIIGKLKWRPHLWLDGPAGSGKSWMLNEIVMPALGAHARRLAKGMEATIRKGMAGHTGAVIFEDQDADDAAGWDRLAAILRIARQASVAGASVQIGSKTHKISATTFLVTTTSTSLEAAADMSRFGFANVGGFVSENDKFHIALAARELFSRCAADGPSNCFADRFAARMALRAGDFEETRRVMIEVFQGLGCERRVGDVYGSFAAGAWLVLRDGVPESVEKADDWLGEVFGVTSEIRNLNRRR